MSAFRQRNRDSKSSHQGGNGSRGDGGCYAIANEASPFSGIYFSYDQVTEKILEMRSHNSARTTGNGVATAQGKGIDFHRFDKIRDAEIFLKGRGFAPNSQPGGWISARNKNPIFYKPSREAMGFDSQQHNSNDIRNNVGTTRSVQSNRYRGQQVTPPLSNTCKANSVENNLHRLWSNHNHGTKEDEDEPSSPDSVHSIICIEDSPEPAEATAASKKTSSFFDPRSKHSFRPNQEQQPEQTHERARKRQRQESQKTNSSTSDERKQRNASGSKNATSAVVSLFAGPQPNFDAVQQEAIDAAMAGKNVFLTGVAGTGKSLVTKKIVEDAKHLGREVAVAAPTGVAAVNLGPELGAQTVHSLAGVGVPQTASGFDKMLSPWTVKKWRKIQVLVLDEIGMLGADFLDWMDFYVRKARRRPLEAFGGIQLIFVGDFAQLGPIPGRGNSIRNSAYEPDNPGADCLLNVSECAAYAFQTVLWREADFHHVHLRKVYRQKNRDFQMALMDIREAKADSERVKTLVNTCSTPLKNREGLQIPEGIKPTILYCTNQNVDRENFENLEKLTEKGKDFIAKDSTSISSAVNIGSHAIVGAMLAKNSFFKDCSASKKITLKVGAQVMLLQNLDIDNGLVNGSRGVVEAFKLCPVAKDVINGEERLIGPDDIGKFPGCRFEDIKFHQQADFDGKIWRICRFDRYPLVRFVNNVSRIIVKHTFERTLYRQGKCLREQIPLRLAWALTIHKSQGATLDYVVCDLQGCFTSGQAYVALSRARSMMGLQIKNFSSKHVTADPLVEEFYDALDRHDMTKFLEERAGLWWYPILKSPSWLKMFSSASSKKAKINSEHFRSWLSEYKPFDGYRGWGV